MMLPPRWWEWVRGSVFCGLWLGSILSGWLLLCCPLLPLMVLRPRTYRLAIDVVFAMWELYPAALIRLVLQTKVVVTGDPVDGAERSLLVMNHRTRLDWNFLWAGMQRAVRAGPQATRLKFVLKAPIAHVPGPGWVMQMACHLYIHRSWERDQRLLAQSLRFFRDMGHTCQILLFPEGTDLTPKSACRSDRWADSHGLPHYEYVLHPKTTGFVFLANTMREYKHLDAIYDVSVGYPKTLVQSEVDLFRGHIPEEIHFHFKRYNVADIPETENDLKAWLEQRWREKEQQLQQFYKDGYFKDSKLQNRKDKAEPTETALCLAFCFWTCLICTALWLILVSTFAQVYALLHAFVFVGLSLFGSGAHIVEIQLHQARQKVLKAN
ncbi:lysocardiolipin acyltransferase 1-like [Frankliniella occidentalis]|uniref:Lysocardiolipin acyltransferase 1-like n=1 Tax=Frankliniella occidentalis TaxID=133901 RepID=A0A6J1SGP0_FRAOC|nr:lysocardiolipin acyltransferase 1-like [Frankliniella occidentalis]